jgi:hypothetical protein
MKGELNGLRVLAEVPVTVHVRCYFPLFRGGNRMARRARKTKLVDRFTVTPGDNRQEQRPFIQNNGGTFSVSTGTEGIIFSLSDSDLLDLITNRSRRRIILEETPPATEPEGTPKRKRQPER